MCACTHTLYTRRRGTHLAEVSLSNQDVEAHGVWPYVVDRALFVLFNLSRQRTAQVVKTMSKTMLDG